MTTAVRCPSKVILVGVTFQCQGELGHQFLCWNDPEGCGGDARIAWKSDPEQMAAATKEALESKGGK